MIRAGNGFPEDNEGANPAGVEYQQKGVNINER